METCGGVCYDSGSTVHKHSVLQQHRCLMSTNGYFNTPPFPFPLVIMVWVNHHRQYIHRCWDTFTQASYDTNSPRTHSLEPITEPEKLSYDGLTHSSDVTVLLSYKCLERIYWCSSHSIKQSPAGPAEFTKAVLEFMYVCVCYCQLCFYLCSFCYQKGWGHMFVNNLFFPSLRWDAEKAQNTNCDNISMQYCWWKRLCWNAVSKTKKHYQNLPQNRNEILQKVFQCSSSVHYHSYISLHSSLMGTKHKSPWRNSLDCRVKGKVSFKLRLVM